MRTRRAHEQISARPELVRRKAARINVIACNLERRAEPDRVCKLPDTDQEDQHLHRQHGTDQRPGGHSHAEDDHRGYEEKVAQVFCIELCTQGGDRNRRHHEPPDYRHPEIGRRCQVQDTDSERRDDDRALQHRDRRSRDRHHRRVDQRQDRIEQNGGGKDSRTGELDEDRPGMPLGISDRPALMVPNPDNKVGGIRSLDRITHLRPPSAGAQRRSS